MQPSIQQERPPYVEFYLHPVEDREASIKAGHYVAKDVEYVSITPMGSKDRVNQKADDWFEKLEKYVRGGRFKAEWLRGYKMEYEAWKKGNEVPLNGTSIKMFTPASPAQIKNLVAMKILTVEDLAIANESVLQRIGMGGRHLKQQAVEWLATSQDIGKVSEESASLKVKVEQLMEENKKMQDTISDLKKEIKKSKEG